MSAPAVDLDDLVEAAAFAGLAGRVPTLWLVAQYPRLGAVVEQDDAAPGARARGPKSPRWTPAADAFLAANLGYLSDADIGRALGRTANAVHLRGKRDLRLASPRSQAAGWITPNRVAESLGIDNKCVMGLIRDGVLPAEPLPWLNQGLYNAYRLRIVTFYRWAINPRHWIYFRPGRVRDLHLRRLLELKAARWGDAWLTPGQVAAMHGVDHKDVNRYIRAGKLPAVRWNNWRILRSDAARVRFAKGKGAGHEAAWSPTGDAFMLLARAIGLSTQATGALVQLSPQTVSYRLRTLCADPAEVIRATQAYGLQVQISADGRLFADWRRYRRRFPAVARAMDRFAAAQADPTCRLSEADRLRVRGVIWSWAMWHARTEEQRQFAENLTYASNATPRGLAAALAELRAWGVEPLSEAGGAA